MAEQQPEQTPKSLFSDEASSIFNNLMSLISASANPPASPSASSSGGDKAQVEATVNAPSEPPADVDSLPGWGAYLGFCHQDKQKAWNLYQHGQAIRKELGLDTVLKEPYPQYDILKEHYKKNILGRSKNDEVVLVESIGKLNLSELKKAGVSRKDIVRHHCMVMEFIFTQLGNADTKVLMMYDLEGLSIFNVMSGDFIGVVRMLSDCLGALYPRRVTRYAIVRPPGIFESLWGLVSAVLPAGAKKDCIMCKNADDIGQLIDPALIPVDFGGTGPKLGDSPEEQKLNAMMKK